MADRNEKILLGLVKNIGNNVCADCRGPDPEWASYNIGIFICTRCAGIHRGLGAHVSKVKHLKLDRWEDSQVEKISSIGNLAAAAHYELNVPAFYRRPTASDPHTLLEQWIRAKYEREEFCHPEKPPPQYLLGTMEGMLWKRGKSDSRYQPRRFVLNQMDDTLKYFVKQKKEPKTILRISEISISFAPAKMAHPNSFQISYMTDTASGPSSESVKSSRSSSSSMNNAVPYQISSATTRHIFLHHEDPKVAVDWYTAIRGMRLRRMQIAYPAESEEELVKWLPKDFAREGWLWKTGPRPSDSYKKRWFTLDNRKLMYHVEPVDSRPKGEIFLGEKDDGYSVSEGRSQGICPAGGGPGGVGGFPFSVVTPDRTFNLSSTSAEDREAWIKVLQAVIDTPVNPRDNSLAAKLCRKRVSGSMNLFNSR
ncbi:arf-GAP with dual PH domain-containing protein 1-like isoform X1 [Ischnura elegans]|uniref:arf-GAP with dual PH domain-containing protein 1-like isoform X1 n=1 Tax=Ischnura elegans TaxID=197161 RepID=UPI001ED88AA6|nr:arf-GAP with dual PH domain-containing protein 1-like isoform X1 [Ischnura elegans]